MNIKTIIIIGLCLIMLINPVLGNNDVDDPKDYKLTEMPIGYEYGCCADYVEENDYYQSFYDTEGGQIYATIYTFRNCEESASKLSYIIKNIKNKNDGYSFFTVNEIYGLGDEAYSTTKTITETGSKFERLYFIKNHILIDVHSVDIISTQSDLMTFAELYENKIDSVLSNAPQLFASIELENGAGSTFYPGDTVIYYVTLSDSANVLIENQVNNDEWKTVSRGYYDKGQSTLYAYVENYDLGNEKLRLTATSLKGSEVISTVAYTTKEREIPTPLPTLTSTQKSTSNETPFLNPFIVFTIFITLALLLNRQKR